MNHSGRMTALTYSVPRSHAGWELYEGQVSESITHDRTVEFLKAILGRWSAQREISVHRNMAVRWVEEDARIGVDPDLSVLRAPPANLVDVECLRTWLPGHEPPMLAIEVVSASNPHKDYSIAPEKYAASGTEELWVLDPLMAGPPAFGGPLRIQIWRRSEAGFKRIYAGDGVAHSPALDAYVVAVADGQRFRITDDPEATRFWLTAEETERNEKNAAHAEIERLKAEVEKLKDR